MVHPASPESRRVLRQSLQLARRDCPRFAAHRLEYHAAGLALTHTEDGAQPVTDALDLRALALRALALGVQRQVHVLGPEDRAILGDLDLVLCPPVVEAGLHVDLEFHTAAGHPQLAYQPVPVRWLALDDGHEVRYLADAIRRQEPGDEHRGFREVQLL